MFSAFAPPVRMTRRPEVIVKVEAIWKRECRGGIPQGIERQITARSQRGCGLVEARDRRHATEVPGLSGMAPSVRSAASRHRRRSRVESRLRGRRVASVDRAEGRCRDGKPVTAIPGLTPRSP